MAAIVINGNAIAATVRREWKGRAEALKRRGVLFEAGILDPAPSGQAGSPPIETLEAAERSHILKALEACGWRVSGKGGTAELLGLRPSTLVASRSTGSTARPERSRQVGTLSTYRDALNMLRARTAEDPLIRTRSCSTHRDETFL
jgi:hypothetical protein